MFSKLVIASGNPGKIKEIRTLLSDLNLETLSAREAGINIEVKETGKSYAANARLKAEAYLSEAQLPVLADDSGLEVDVLDGAPGIFSARYAPNENATDADRRQYLLSQLEGLPRPWKAHFHCTAVLALPGGFVAQTKGRCDGIIIPEERGQGGFGYDPIFFLPEHDATMAEIPAELKNRISHRARAIAAMLPSLNKLLEIKTDD
jgi:XTP/dITP diphosphohydrolase